MKGQAIVGLLLLLTQWQIISAKPPVTEPVVSEGDGGGYPDYEYNDPRCPYKPGQFGTCEYECEMHSDCPSGELCCYNGCGTSCTKPSMSEDDMGGGVPGGLEAIEQYDNDLRADLEQYDAGIAKSDFLKDVENELEKIADTEQALFQATLPAIKHGDTIALQTSTRHHWLGCAGSKCGPAGCPSMFMEGADWKNCWGEVFRIYHNPSGISYREIRVGDMVGIYYPRASRWFGCPANNYCDKRSCPGNPTMTYGFQTSSHWRRCWGEVFRIYAHGRGLGNIIRSGDDIMLYYPRQNRWVSQLFSGPTAKRGCPGTIRPPPAHRYDRCWGEVFNIMRISEDLEV